MPLMMMGFSPPGSTKEPQQHASESVRVHDCLAGSMDNYSEGWKPAPVHLFFIASHRKAHCKLLFGFYISVVGTGGGHLWQLLKRSSFASSM